MNLRRLSTEATDVSQELNAGELEQPLQTSDAAKQTAKPQTKPTGKETQDDVFKPLVLDPTRQVIHPKHPEQPIAADELWTTYNRGKLHDKVQSDLHKTQSELDKAQAQLTEQQKIIQQYETREMLANQLKQMGIIPESQQKSVSKQTSELDNWLTGDEETQMNQQQPQQPFSPEMLQKIVESTISRYVGELSKQNQDILNNAMAQNRMVQQQEQAQQAAFRTGDKITEANLRASFPDANEAEMKEIVRLQNSGLRSFAEAMAASSSGDMDTMTNKLAENAEYISKAQDLRLKLALGQREHQSEAEARAELEALTAPAETEPEPLEEWEIGKPVNKVYKADASRTAFQDALNNAMKTAKKTDLLYSQYPMLRPKR